MSVALILDSDVFVRFIMVLRARERHATPFALVCVLCRTYNSQWAQLYRIITMLWEGVGIGINNNVALVCASMHHHPP